MIKKAQYLNEQVLRFILFTRTPRRKTHPPPSCGRQRMGQLFQIRIMINDIGKAVYLMLFFKSVETIQREAELVPAESSHLTAYFSGGIFAVLAVADLYEPDAFAVFIKLVHPAIK